MASLMEFQDKNLTDEENKDATSKESLMTIIDIFK